MKGYLMPVQDGAEVRRGSVARWEARAAEAVGTAIEFWGFKANHGRVWALLYLRGKAMSAGAIQEALGLSKGAVSMVTRELEQWRVVRRVRPPCGDCWCFEAETDLLGMVGRVVSEREARFVARIESDLAEAEREATRAGAAREVIERLTRMRSLATRARQAIETFVATARFDFRGIASLLSSAQERLRRRRA